MDAPARIYLKYIVISFVLLGILAGLRYATTLPDWVFSGSEAIFVLLMFVAVKDTYFQGYLRGRREVGKDIGDLKASGS